MIIYNITRIESRFGASAVLSELTHALSSKDPHVRAASLELQITYIPTRRAEIGAEKEAAFAAIQAAMSDLNAHVRLVAARAMSTLEE